MSEIPKIWKCAWHEGDYWFDHKQGEVHPEIIPLFPSHGICDKCLQKQKAILAAMKESEFRPGNSAAGEPPTTSSLLDRSLNTQGEPVPIDFNHFGAA